MPSREKCSDPKANAECMSLYNTWCLKLFPCYNRTEYAGKDRIKKPSAYGTKGDKRMAKRELVVVYEKEEVK